MTPMLGVKRSSPSAKHHPPNICTACKFSCYCRSYCKAHAGDDCEVVHDPRGQVIIAEFAIGPNKQSCHEAETECKVDDEKADFEGATLLVENDEASNHEVDVGKAKEMKLK